MKIRAKTLRAWLLANSTASERRDIVSYGADTGILDGLIAYEDTTKLFLRFGDEVFDLVTGDEYGRLRLTDMMEYESLAEYRCALVQRAVELLAGDIINYGA